MNALRPALRWWKLAVVALVGGLLPLPEIQAQTTDLSVEVGGSSVSPPIGVEGDDARFVVAGVRGLRLDAGGSGLMGSFLVGRSLEEGAGGDFLSGTLDGRLLKPFGQAWAAGVEVKTFGFRVAAPFPYRSLGLEGGPVLRFETGNLSASLKGIGGGGWSETELARTGERPSEIVKDELWRYGGEGEVLAGAGGVLGGLAAGVHETSGGTYRSVGLRLLVARSRGALELRVDAWDTPLGSETTGGVAFILPLGGWDVRGFLGRTEPDPLTLAEPGGGSGGLLVGRRLMGSDPLPPPKEPLHRIVEWRPGGAMVEIHLEGPENTEELSVLGDFTLWEPVPMIREGSRWSVRLEIPPGIYHFGFLADGQWYLPEDTPDAVPDDWGRENATIVIEEGQDPAPSSSGRVGGEGVEGR
jgi:hypothetical protein